MLEKDFALKYPPLHSWDVLMSPLGCSFGTNHLGSPQAGVPPSSLLSSPQLEWHWL